MKIELTKKQYCTFFMMLYCGEWVLNSYKKKKDRIYKDTDDYEQYIFSFANDNTFDEWIEYDEGLDRYFPTAIMEEELHKFIRIYNKRQFDR